MIVDDRRDRRIGSASRAGTLVERAPLLLALAGVLTPLAGMGFATLPMALLWLAAIAVVVAWDRLRPVPRTTRIGAALVAVPLLFLAAFEGGWWLIPAVVSRIAIDAFVVVSRRRERAEAA